MSAHALPLAALLRTSRPDHPRSTRNTPRTTAGTTQHTTY
jgi:hypothetical protein